MHISIFEQCIIVVVRQLSIFEHCRNSNTTFFGGKLQCTPKSGFVARVPHGFRKVPPRLPRGSPIRFPQSSPMLSQCSSNVIPMFLQSSPTAPPSLASRNLVGLYGPEPWTCVGSAPRNLEALRGSTSRYLVGLGVHLPGSFEVWMAQLTGTLKAGRAQLPGTL